MRDHKQSTDFKHALEHEGSQVDYVPHQDRDATFGVLVRSHHKHKYQNYVEKHVAYKFWGEWLLLSANRSLAQVAKCLLLS